MMKSFFKKLAFVMALAMVVSAMAPAATAKAAEAKTVDICVQNDNYIERPTYELTEGAAPVDFCFAGAPDWKNYTWTWDSSDKDVATVDNAGLVTLGTKTGETVITVKGGDVYTGSMVLTVNPKVVVPAYEVKQTAADKLTVTWADAKNATTNVEVYKVYELTDGNKEVKWPSETVVKDGVATVTVKYGGLEDGYDYVVKFGNVEKTIAARVGKVVDIEVKAVAYEWKDTNNDGVEEMVDVKGLYVSEDNEYPIRFDVTYITDNDIKFTTAPEDTSIDFDVLEGGEDIYLDSDGVESLIYEKGAWAHVVATYTYSDEEDPIEYDFFIEGVEKEVAKLAGITKYTLVAVEDDKPAVKKADATWNNTKIIVDDRAYVAVEVTDTLGGSKYFGLKESDYTNEFGIISYLSANDEILLVGEEGLVTPVSTGTTSVIVQLSTKDADGNYREPKPIYAFDVEVKASRKEKDVTANNVTVLTNGELIASKANVEIVVTDNYGNPWKGFTAKVETTSDVADEIKSISVTDAADGTVDGKAILPIDGSKFPANTNSVTYKVTVGSKSTTFKVTLKDNKNTVSGYVAEVGNVTIDGKKSGTINGEVKVYSFWRSGGVEYKLANVTSTVEVYDNSITDYWTKNPENLEGALVVTVKNPSGDDKYTARLDGDKIIIPGVASVDTTAASGGALTVTEGTYEVTVTKVKNTKLVAGSGEDGDIANRYEVTRKNVEAEESFTVTNAAEKLSAPVFADASVYEGATIKDVIMSYVSYTFHGDDEWTIDDIAHIKHVDCIANEEAGKVYVKTITVKVPVYNPAGNNNNGEELNCYFEQTLTINKLLPCDLITW